ncbi:MAG: CHASE domain-containing protein [Myxococcota bacterium]
MRSAKEAAALTGPRLLLLCNLLLAFVAALVVWSYDRASHEQRELRVVERTHSDLQAGLDLTVALLRGANGFFEASDAVSGREFRAYVETLDLRRRHPSLLGIGYAKRVGPSEVGALEQAMREQGLPRFRVWPPPTSEDNTAIVYLEPPDRGNLRAFGFDMTSEPVRRAAMERAHAAGARVMYLEVAVDNLSAQELYRAHGFERVGLRPDYYERADGSRVSAHTMRCDLDHAFACFEPSRGDGLNAPTDRLS